MSRFQAVVPNNGLLAINKWDDKTVSLPSVAYKPRFSIEAGRVMRAGTHPTKELILTPEECHHRVIIPVFIPEVSGYYLHALKILELCLESLKNTAAGRVAVTLISNGCCKEAIQLLEKFYAEGWIEQLKINSHNRGKVESIVGLARGTHEEILTFADNDVLFRSGWLEGIEQIFHDFPECGIASPTPVPSLCWAYTSSTVIDSYLRGELIFEKVVDEQDMRRFANSIDNPTVFKPIHFEKQLVVKRKQSRACVGCGHFICSIRREVMAAMPKKRCMVACGGWAVSEWIDSPPDQLGYWRLSTTNMLAYHMGNTPEPWMEQELQNQREERVGSAGKLSLSSLAVPQRHWASWLGNWTRLKGLSLVRKLPRFRDYR